MDGCQSGINYTRSLVDGIINNELPLMDRWIPIFDAFCIRMPNGQSICLCLLSLALYCT